MRLKVHARRKKFSMPCANLEKHWPTRKRPTWNSTRRVAMLTLRRWRIHQVDDLVRIHSIYRWIAFLSRCERQCSLSGGSKTDRECTRSSLEAIVVSVIIFFLHDYRQLRNSLSNIDDRTWSFPSIFHFLQINLLLNCSNTSWSENSLAK